MKKAGTRATLLVLLAGASAASTGETAVERLMNGVYAEGGQTLYCQREFDPESRVRADYIYPERRLRSAYECRVRRICLRNEGYVAAVNDLHNIFFARRSVELERRGTRLREVPGDPEDDCGYKSAFQTFEPPDHAKGVMARAILYMHVQHELPVFGSTSMILRWAREFPVTDEERTRNDRIEEIQGNRNPFIDDPDRVNTLIFD